MCPNGRLPGFAKDIPIKKSRENIVSNKTTPTSGVAKGALVGELRCIFTSEDVVNSSPVASVKTKPSLQGLDWALYV